MARPSFVRVKDKETGHEYSVTEARYERTPDLWTKVDKPATDSAGDPLPAKHKTTVTKKATAKAESGHQAPTDSKETS